MTRTNVDTRLEVKDFIETMSQELVTENFDKHPGRLQDKMIIRLAYILQRIAEDYEICDEDSRQPMTALELASIFSDKFEEDLVFNEL